MGHNLYPNYPRIGLVPVLGSYGIYSVSPPDLRFLSAECSSLRLPCLRVGPRSASRARAVRINLLSSGGLRMLSSSVEFVDGPAAMVARPSGTTI